MNRLCLFGLLVIFLFVGAGYSSHVISSETRLNISGVFGEADEGRNWTGANACEIVNFTIVNDGGCNDSIVSVNVTVPLGFTLNTSTIGYSSGWACSNLSATIVNCSNMSVGGLVSGSTMYVWFNVTSDSLDTEAMKDWVINTSDNATQMNGTILNSWVDGNVTVTAQMDALDVYMNSQPVLNWTNHNGSDAVSGLSDYTIYHSTDGANVNFTVNGTTNNMYYQTSGLSENHIHYFKVETRDNAGNARNSSVVVNTTIDTDAPVVELNTTDNENFSYTYYPQLYFNATDNYEEDMSCEVFVDGHPNGTGYIAHNESGLSIQVNTSLIGEGHQWYVNCTDEAGNTGNSTNRTLNVVGADVNVTMVYFNSSDFPNIVDASNITVFAVVQNIGNMNLTNNVTVMFYMDSAYIANKTISNETLTVGPPVTVNVTKTGNLKQNSFNHTLRAEAVTDNIELDESNNDAYNYSLYVGYNVTITEISPDVVDNTSVNVSVTFSVKYPDGNGVTLIPWSNVTITGSTYDSDDTNSSVFVEEGSGVYSFSVTSYVNYGGDTNPGLHIISVTATRNESGKIYSGVDTDAYNQTVPRPDCSQSGTDGAIYKDHAEDAVITIKNSGSTTLYNVTATPTVYLGSTEKSIIGTTNCWSIPNNLTAGETRDCTFTITPTSDGEHEIRLAVTGKDDAGRTYTRSFSGVDWFDVTTQATTPQDPNTNTPSGDTPSTDTDYPNCATDDDCFGDEYCNMHLVCKELDCADDEIIMDHACVKKDDEVAAQIAEYSLGITGPDALEIEHGAFRNVTFNLKNTGEKNVTGLSFSLDFADDSVDAAGWYVVLSNYSDALESGGVVSVKVEINTVNLSIGAHDVVALAESSEANANLSFSLKVTPDDDEKIVINDTIVKLDSEYMEMYDQLQVLLHEYANNTNVTELNDTLFAVAEYLESAKAAIGCGDYLSAYENQKSAESLMLEIKSRLESGELAGGEKKSNWLRNSLIVVVLLIAGLFGWQYYSMNMQQTAGGFQHGRGFRLKKKKRTLNEGVMKEVSMLSGMIKSNKSKSKPSPFTYAYGNYGSKGMVSCASKKEGVFDRFKGMFRKNKRDVTQKTLYDISSVYSKKKSKKLKVRCL